MKISMLSVVMVLVALFGLIGPWPAFVKAQGLGYRPTPGLDKVNAAMQRLKKEGDQLSPQTRDALLKRGEACLTLERLDKEGKAPINDDIRAFIQRGRPASEVQALNAKIHKHNDELISVYSAFVRDTNAAFARVKQPAKARPQLTINGKADGGTTDNQKFPRSAGAKGSLDLNVLGSTIRKIQTDWEAAPVGTARVDPDNNTHKTQEWEFTSKEYGTAKVTIKGDENGAAGTATGWQITTKDGTVLRIKFSVQFSGDKLLLHTFAQDVDK
jgi:hypothetical protein